LLVTKHSALNVGSGGTGVTEEWRMRNVQRCVYRAVAGGLLVALVGCGGGGGDESRADAEARSTSTRRATSTSVDPRVSTAALRRWWADAQPIGIVLTGARAESAFSCEQKRTQEAAAVAATGQFERLPAPEHFTAATGRVVVAVRAFAEASRRQADVNCSSSATADAIESTLAAEVAALKEFGAAADAVREIVEMDFALPTDEEAAPSSSSTTLTPTTRVPSPIESAEAAFRRLLDYASKGQYGRQWDDLHPAQQAFVNRDLFVRCYGEKLGGLDVIRINVVDTFQEEQSVPGTDVRQLTTGISAEVTYRRDGQESTSTDTYHEYLVDGRWRWALGDPDAYKRGECPAT
jgi:hypothetical protein